MQCNAMYAWQEWSHAMNIVKQQQQQYQQHQRSSSSSSSCPLRPPWLTHCCCMWLADCCAGFKADGPSIDKDKDYPQLVDDEERKGKGNGNGNGNNGNGNGNGNRKLLQTCPPAPAAGCVSSSRVVSGSKHYQQAASSNACKQVRLKAATAD